MGAVTTKLRKDSQRQKSFHRRPLARGGSQPLGRPAGIRRKELKMAESLRQAFKKAIRVARKRHEIELTAKTEALNDAAAAAVKERINPALIGGAFDRLDHSDEDESRR